jgi:hypothetical protein
MFSTRQHLNLRALLDRLIPPDDDPGAWEAGVGDYLARQFAGDLRDFVLIYQVALDALDAEAQAGGAPGFAELPPAAQDALLRRVEAGQVAAAWPIDPARFFQAAVEHAIEGYYSDPGNGGNRGEVAWRMIGFLPGDQVRPS